MDTFNISFDEFIRLKSNPAVSLAEEVYVYDREYLMSEHLLNHEINPSIRVNSVVFILCRYGRASFSMDSKTYYLAKGTMLWLSSYNVIDDVKVDNNCEAMVVVISTNLIRAIVREMPVVKKVMKIAMNRLVPVYHLEDDEMRDLVETITRIQKYLKKTDHDFQRHLVKNETSNFVMETTHIYLQKMNIADKSPIKENRKDEIFKAFTLLLLQHNKEYREVTFYAGKLGMTPGNLTRHVTAASGKSPMQWIGDLLVAEAKTLLRKPDATIKQVADEMNFGDQSSFGKFFKRHAGMTPMEYKARG